jgi:hypothetical protein
MVAELQRLGLAVLKAGGRLAEDLRFFYITATEDLGQPGPLPRLQASTSRGAQAAPVRQQHPDWLTQAAQIVLDH